jgi:hypothetical protein
MTDEKPKRGALLYYQLASVILLLVLVGFSISGLWGLIKIAIPKLTIANYEWKTVSTFDRYAQDKYREKNGLYFQKFEKEDTTVSSAFTREQIETKWKSAQQDVLDDEQREGLQRIMLWFVVVLVCLPLYLYHHKAVKKARQMMEQAAGQ